MAYWKTINTDNFTYDSGTCFEVLYKKLAKENKIKYISLQTYPDNYLKIDINEMTNKINILFKFKSPIKCTIATNKDIQFMKENNPEDNVNKVILAFRLIRDYKGSLDDLINEQINYVRRSAEYYWDNKSPFNTNRYYNSKLQYIILTEFDSFKFECDGSKSNGVYAKEVYKYLNDKKEILYSYIINKYRKINNLINVLPYKMTTSIKKYYEVIYLKDIDRFFTDELADKYKLSVNGVFNYINKLVMNGENSDIKKYAIRHIMENYYSELINTKIIIRFKYFTPNGRCVYSRKEYDLNITYRDLIYGE